jgi:hypothetical protein
MIEEIKLLLGDAAENYTEPQIELAYRMAAAEVEDYCKRELDTVLEFEAMKIAVIALNRRNTEGLAAQGFSGVSESFLTDLPDDILRVLNRKRKIKVV